MWLGFPPLSANAGPGRRVVLLAPTGPTSDVERSLDPGVRPMTEKKSRRLAAVMYTDVVGYPAMMQDDEEAAQAVTQTSPTSSPY